MTVFVDEAVSEVIPEREPAAQEGEGEDTRWQEVDRLRRRTARLRRIERRTAARGFDD